MSTVLASKDDIVAQLLAMKQELSSLSLRGASRGTQQRKSPVRRQSAVETGDGEFAELAPARMSLPLSDADAACHYKRTVGPQHPPTPPTRLCLPLPCGKGKHNRVGYALRTR